MRFARQATISTPIHRPMRLTGTVAAARGGRTELAASSVRPGPRARFAGIRLHHTVELVGACVMMAAFLILALFA